ncbi:MAG TPA: hypothetical protein VLI39_16335 [Sedimentisphaerales bacterium]|nr:hypothetical protein [Sedimentisphaerales bacterium]
MKTFWQHANGQVYAVESDTFGRIIGAAGPFELDELRDPGEYTYQCGLTAWISRAIEQHKLRRINPVLSR